MSETIYKVLGPGRTAWHGGRGKWAQKRRWMPTISPIVPCERGYHLCRGEEQLTKWLGPEIWVAEYDGEMVEAADKIVVGRARLIERTPWDERIARLFAADCAEAVLPIFEERHPGDDRPRKAIEAARLYANGEIDKAPRGAALSAAWSAAESAAWGAAWGAARSAAESAAVSAAWSAAVSAAWSAAESAAESAARSAARSAQAANLHAYLTGEKP